MSYEVIPITSDCWAIQDGNVRMYLLDGGTASVLIDTGYGTGALRRLVFSLAHGEIHVVNTHSHNDHTSGNSQFDHFYMGTADAPVIIPSCPANARIETVQDGDIITAGSVSLEVIAIPGHTPGAIALLDRARRILFSGDTFAKMYPIYMQFPGQDMSDYLNSMRRLESMQDAYDRICPAHGELVIEKDYIRKTINCAHGILTGSIEAGLAKLADGNDDRAYWYEDVAIFA